MVNIYSQPIAHLKPGCDTCLPLCDTSDTFLLRLSWLVSCSDEEGNIRRMIYILMIHDIYD